MDKFEELVESRKGKRFSVQQREIFSFLGNANEVMGNVFHFWSFFLLLMTSSNYKNFYFWKFGFKIFYFLSNRNGVLEPKRKPQSKKGKNVLLFFLTKNPKKEIVFVNFFLLTGGIESNIPKMIAAIKYPLIRQ